MIVAVAWGWMGHRSIAVCAVLMWGIGDAAAALIGIPFGRHRIHWKLTDGKKSVEGTAAMFAASCAVGLILLRMTTEDPVLVCIVHAVIGAAFAALTELLSKNGTDTVTVPSVLTVVLYLLRGI